MIFLIDLLLRERSDFFFVSCKQLHEISITVYPREMTSWGISGDTESAPTEDKYKAGKEQNEKQLLKNV